MTSETRRFLAAALAASLLGILCFLPGLDAGFLLDDFDNFDGIQRFLAGDLTWQGAVFGNRSGPLGRPLSMASFTLGASLHGLEPRPLLATNLLLHLASAVLVFLLARRLLGLSVAIDKARCAWIALALAFIWAVMPLQVSVVLYTVQRMALLSGFFAFAALLTFVIGRQRLRDGAPGWRLLLFGAFPAITALSVLSKENGALVPLIAGAIELTWFRRTHAQTEARARLTFFGLFLFFPAAIATMALLIAPERLLGGYEVRSFTLAERLLTQPRVLWDYVRHIVLPFGPGMGLIHDDFPRSTTLFAPPTTALAIAGWIAATALAWRLRDTAPGILGGVLIFLCAHAMESTILPLEMYFEHRNYVAAVGILIAAVAILDLGLTRLNTPTAAFRGVLVIAAMAVPLAFAGATFARATVWGNPASRMAQALEANPHSPRLRSQLAVTTAYAGDLEGALEHVRLAGLGPAAPPLRTLELWRIVSACLAKASLDGQDTVATAVQASMPRIALTEMKSFEALAQRIEGRQCAWPTAAQAIELGQSMLAHTRQPATAHEVWRVRYNVARLVASTGDLDAAVAVAEQAWADSRWNGGVGILVFQLHASRNDLKACRRTLDRFTAMDLSRDIDLQRAVEQFRAYVHSSGQTTQGNATPTGSGVLR